MSITPHERGHEEVDIEGVGGSTLRERGHEEVDIEGVSGTTILRELPCMGVKHHRHSQAYLWGAKFRCPPTPPKCCQEKKTE